MIQLNTDQAIRQLKKGFSNLSEAETKKGIVSAINRSLQFGKTEGGRQIKNAYNVTGAMLSPAIKTENARTSLMIGKINASAKPMGLSNFSPVFSFNKKSTTKYSASGIGKSKLLKKQSTDYGKGVSVEIIKGKRVSIPFAFMIAGKNPVFARGEYKTGGAYGFVRRHKRINKTGADTPIAKLLTTTIYTAFISDKVMPQVEPKISEKFQERMIHELKYRMNKIS